MVAGTYRWLMSHSALQGSQGDGILIGASSLAQLRENLTTCQSLASAEQGLLAPEVLAAFDDAWQVTREGAFPYWRSYSQCMPEASMRDQGAAYNAAKTK